MSHVLLPCLFTICLAFLAVTEAAAITATTLMPVDWQERVSQHPDDQELQGLHALWIGLCFKVEVGDIIQKVEWGRASYYVEVEDDEVENRQFQVGVVWEGESRSASKTWWCKGDLGYRAPDILQFLKPRWPPDPRLLDALQYPFFARTGLTGLQNSTLFQTWLLDLLQKSTRCDLLPRRIKSLAFSQNYFYKKSILFRLGLPEGEHEAVTCAASLSYDSR